MQNFKVPLTRVLEVNGHPNADRLELVTVYGFQCVTAKGEYKPGDKVIYVPIDSVIPQNLEDFLFPPGAKIDRRSAKRRIKQIRIRSFPSQGIILNEKDLVGAYGDRFIGSFKWTSEESDLSGILKIEKYEAPIPVYSVQNKTKKPKDSDHPMFDKFGGLENIKWYPNMFKPDELVEIQEKLHGTNHRMSLLPTNLNTWWKKLKNFFGFMPKYEYCYGSNKVQLQNNESKDDSGYYSKNIYKEVFEKHKDKLKPGEVVYGEIIGWAGKDKPIQKGYTYGLPNGEMEFVLFDVKILNSDGSSTWLDPINVSDFAHERGFKIVPILDIKKFGTLEENRQYTLGDSVYAPSQKVREGVVIKSVENYNNHGEKKALKFISEAYLDKDQTDYH